MGPFHYLKGRTLKESPGAFPKKGSLSILAIRKITCTPSGPQNKFGLKSGPQNKFGLKSGRKINLERKTGSKINLV